MNETIPIFKTHCSFGKSVLTDSPCGKYSEGGPMSIFKIAEREGLKTLFLAEETMIGFFNCHKIAKEMGIKLIFGVYFTVHDPRNEKHGSKVLVFSKNDAGQKELQALYSLCKTNPENTKISEEILRKNITDNLQLVVPFYDSFLHWNSEEFDSHFINLEGLNPVFLKEQKSHSFDNIITTAVDKYCAEHHFETLNAHTIYYDNDKDFVDLQVYKMICNKSYSGKKQTIGNPNLEHFCSDEFSWESYKRKHL
tara:strand:- start:2048 stop:2803 length:756 start_codon:yes stop_codon:yes gene_type:complete